MVSLAAWNLSLYYISWTLAMIIKGTCLVRHKIKTDLLAQYQHWNEVGANEKLNMPSSTFSAPFYTFMDTAGRGSTHTFMKRGTIVEQKNWWPSGQKSWDCISLQLFTYWASYLHLWVFRSSFTKWNFNTSLVGFRING